MAFHGGIHESALTYVLSHPFICILWLQLERAVVERMEATKHVARSAYKEEDHQPKPPKPWSIFG